MKCPKKRSEKEKTVKVSKPKQGPPGDDKAKAKAKAKPAADAAGEKEKAELAAQEKAKAKAAAEAARPPADPRLKVLKKFHGKFLPKRATSRSAQDLDGTLGIGRGSRRCDRRGAQVVIQRLENRSRQARQSAVLRCNLVGETGSLDKAFRRVMVMVLQAVRRCVRC